MPDGREACQAAANNPAVHTVMLVRERGAMSRYHYLLASIPPAVPNPPASGILLSS